MKKILYVDDARSMRKLVELVLSKHYDVTTAENGQEGLNAILKENFDVVISDVNMPVMTGLEFLGHLRQQAQYKFVPVLMLTTEASDELKEQGKQLGATGWIVKPFDPEKLIKILERF
ncbi:response regulator [Thiomicrorhabdus aquaedulcis]|jgi:two-component system chemotaxis response regulator CheY|uniref:response regulator n=1 Tax=Thiomicrorhabdus aquaedulcis TaxID=2211106 RepID=UPI000FDAFBB0|nr:response regulator [Thiomicrorhabdus aquaedulcis]